MKIKALLIMIVTIIAGYFVAPVIGLKGLDNVSLVFAIGIFVGAIFQVFLIAMGSVENTSEGNFGSDSDSNDSSGNKTVYVGNLDFEITEDKVEDLFRGLGNVISVRLMKDKETGRGRGFGFVEMSVQDANKAIEKLNGVEFEGRTLKVNIANEKRSRPRRRHNNRR